MHPGTAKDTMINALQLAIDFHNQLPKDQVPGKTDGAEGFFHLMALNGTVEEEKWRISFVIMIVKRLKIVKTIKLTIQEKMNAQFDEARIQMDLYDQYYNMKEIIEKRHEYY